MTHEEIAITVTGAPRVPHTISPQAADRLKDEETGGVWDGKRLRLLPIGTPALAAYPDSGGVWTCGWGATGRDVFKGVRWTLLQCSLRFESDVGSRVAALRALLKAGTRYTSQSQFDALLLLAFNIGIPSLTTSTLLKLHNRGDFEGAGKQFSRWCHDNGRVVGGLVDRRERERGLYESADFGRRPQLTIPCPTLIHAKEPCL